jgi:hypothetical protein
MRSILLVSLLFIAISTHAQMNVTGKTFTAKTGESCKEMPDGGCTINYFCSLTFGPDSVTVHNYTKASCTNKKLEAGYEKNLQDSKTYKYTISNSMITIISFDTYGTYEEKGNALIGKKGNAPLMFEKSTIK